jgi:hypothetical protein
MKSSTTTAMAMAHPSRSYNDCVSAATHEDRRCARAGRRGGSWHAGQPVSRASRRYLFPLAPPQNSSSDTTNPIWQWAATVVPRPTRWATNHRRAGGVKVTAELTEPSSGPASWHSDGLSAISTVTY